MRTQLLFITHSSVFWHCCVLAYAGPLYILPGTVCLGRAARMSPDHAVFANLVMIDSRMDSPPWSSSQYHDSAPLLEKSQPTPSKKPSDLVLRSTSPTAAMLRSPSSDAGLASIERERCESEGLPKLSCSLSDSNPFPKTRSSLASSFPRIDRSPPSAYCTPTGLRHGRQASWFV